MLILVKCTIFYCNYILHLVVVVVMRSSHPQQHKHLTINPVFLDLLFESWKELVDELLGGCQKCVRK
jgi:hypothetical protein